MDKTTILFVDDDELYREMIADVLDGHGEFNLLLAEDGEEGFHLYREHNISLVILDIRMPKMSGVDFLRAINDHSDNKPPIIVMSGYASKKEQEECFALGIDYYLEKPLEIDKLRAKVKSCLAPIG